MIQQFILYAVTTICLCWPYYYYPNTHVDRLNQQYGQWRNHYIQPRPQPPIKRWKQHSPAFGYTQQYLPLNQSYDSRSY